MPFLKSKGKNVMTFSGKCVLGLVVAVGFMQAGQNPAAADSGSFTLTASLTSQYTSITHVEGTLFSGVSQGTSTTVQSSADPFVEGSSMQTLCIVSGAASAAGTELEAACTSTSTTGDLLFSSAKRRVDGAADEESVGQLTLLGGTGVYTDITGSCSYENEYLTDTLYVTWAQCTWQR